MTLVELVLGIHDVLATASIPHAFGGALALAYVAEPRATVGVDVNVFVPIGDIQPVLDALATTGLRPADEPTTWLPIAGIRLAGAAPYPVDLFPSLDDDIYAEMDERSVGKPFGPGRALLPFLSPADLVTFKLSFGRAKDWVDLQAIVTAAPDLDVDYIERQLIALRGPAMYPRLARLRSMLASGGPPPERRRATEG